MPVDFFELVAESDHDSLQLRGYEVVHIDLELVDVVLVVGPAYVIL